MGAIRILPAEISGRIAAGEVIDRPASVVKELVENAIDAKATRIRVMTEQGGQRLIQVIDDGCGMEREDAMMCLEAHATSKISDDGDVGKIQTLGFRGEAVPSIASVSKFQIQTRRADELEGTEVIVNYGKIEAINDCGCAPGTNIKVSYLFGNLPARRKFLKGPNTEDSHIEETMLLLALSRPDIAFELTMNGRTVMRSSSAHDIAARTVMLLGKENFEAMLPVNYHEDGIHVYGYISKPGFTRNSRRDQRFIINGRAAVAETIFYAIRDAYDTLIIKGRYPSTILYIDLQPDRVDVNVHPAKREVRFRDPLKVSAIIAAAVRQSLRQLPGAVTVTPDYNPDSVFNGSQQEQNNSSYPEEKESVAQPDFPEQPPVEDDDAPPAPLPLDILPPVVPKPASFTPHPTQTTFDLNLPPVASHEEGKLTSQLLDDMLDKQDGNGQLPPVAPASTFPNLRLRGRLGQNYLLAESPTGLVVVNIRAASQRILFERFLSNLKNDSHGVARQPLLMPITLNLSPDETRFLNGELPHFDALGFSIEPFGGHSFLITALPLALSGDQDVASVIRDIIDDLRHSHVSNRQNSLSLAQAAARFGGGRPKAEMSEAEQRDLLSALSRCEMPYACPNGLPTMLHFTFAELERRFKNG